MSNSALFKQIGRLTFLLSSACVAVVCGLAQFLQQTHPDDDRVAAAVKLGVVLAGVYWIRSLERRLMDAGLPRWIFWPYFLAVFIACVGVHARGILDGPETLVFFVVIQIPTVLFPSKPAFAALSPQNAMQAGVPGQLYPEYNRPVARFQFLLRVLMIAAIYVSLLQLARGAGPGVESWEMRLGIVLFAFIWIYSVEGRVMDAGLSRWLSIPYCLILPGVCVLPRFLSIINVHVALTLFVVLQIPTIFFQSRVADTSHSSLDTGDQEVSNLAAMGKEKPIRKDTRVDGFEFTVYVLLIAGLWYVLHLLRGDAGAGPMSWAVDSAVDACALFLCVPWVVTVKGRLKDAGLPPWAIDFCLIVFTVSLLPLAFRVISFPQALVLFVASQIPAVFIRRGSIPAKLLPVDTDC